MALKVGIYKLTYIIGGDKEREWKTTIAGYDVADIQKFLNSFTGKAVQITEIANVTKIDALTDTVVNDVTKIVKASTPAPKKKPDPQAPFGRDKHGVPLTKDGTPDARFKKKVIKE